MSNLKRPANSSIAASLFSNEKDDARDRKRPLSLSDTLFGQQTPSAASTDDDKGTEQTSPPQKKNATETVLASSQKSSSTFMLFDSKKADDYKLASEQLRKGNTHTSSSSDYDDIDDDYTDDIDDDDDDDDEDDDDEDDNEEEEEVLEVSSDPEQQILNNRRLRHRNLSSIKASEIINMDLSTCWPTGSADGHSNGNGVARLPSESAGIGQNRKFKGGTINSDGDTSDDEEVLAGRQRMAIAMIATIFQEMGLVVLKPSKSNKNEPKTASSSGKNITGGGDVKDLEAEEDKGGDVQAMGTTPLPGKKGKKVSIFPPNLMNELVQKAKQIEAEVCNRLDEVGEIWRADGNPSTNIASDDKDGSSTNGKMPSRETAALENKIKQQRKKRSTSFRYHEVAARCPGRLDVRWKMDEPPFNDPRIVENPILFPIVSTLLGGTLPVGAGPNNGGRPGGGATLTYAGLIFSFPNSSDQPWHMDGATLFPEEQHCLDLPPYALNVFIPLEEVTDELGPTEFLPASHLADQAEKIDHDLHEWAVNQSLADMGSPVAASKSGSNPEFCENEWMERLSVVAPCLELGDVLIYDYRVCHRGTKNLSKTKTRPMLYLMYSRPWFKEHLNFGNERLFPIEDEREIAASAPVKKNKDYD